MKFYNSKITQAIVIVLYAAAVFAFLCAWWIMSSPWTAIVCTVIFCALWRNIRNVLISTVVALFMAVPLWWFIFGRHSAQSSDIRGWYPLIILNFLLFVLLPEVIIVGVRNVIIRRVAHR